MEPRFLEGPAEGPSQGLSSPPGISSVIGAWPKVLSDMLQGWMMKRINDEQGVHNEVDMWTPVLSRKRPPQTLHYERILPKKKRL